MTSKISVTYQSCRSAGVFLFTQDFLVFLNSLQFNNRFNSACAEAARGPWLKKLSIIIRALTVFSTDMPSLEDCTQSNASK